MIQHQHLPLHRGACFSFTRGIGRVGGCGGAGAGAVGGGGGPSVGLRTAEAPELTAAALRGGGGGGGGEEPEPEAERGGCWGRVGRRSPSENVFFSNSLPQVANIINMGNDRKDFIGKHIKKSD